MTPFSCFNQKSTKKIKLKQAYQRSILHRILHYDIQSFVDYTVDTAL